MKEILIQENEQRFTKTLIDSAGKQFTCISTEDIGGAILKKIRPKTNSGFFYNEKTEKSAIVIHSTVGVLTGDVATLTNSQNPVSVSYLIARNGIIFELFDPKLWSYHLGKGTIGGNKLNSSRSIGIELSNMGPLKVFNKSLETIYSRVKIGEKTTATDIYCDLIDDQIYTKLDTPYRSYNYFAKFTEAQYKSLNILIRKLSVEFSIPMNFVHESQRYNVFNESLATSYKGICSHVNFRSEGKLDVGPDFEWNKIISDIHTKKEEIKSVELDNLSVPSKNAVNQAPKSTISSWKESVSAIWTRFVK